jgi:hypothetical protein
MMEIELKALGLLKFVETPEGDAGRSDEQREMKKAQAMINLNKAVVKNM